MNKPLRGLIGIFGLICFVIFIVLTVNIAIGIATPPYGLDGIYVSSVHTFAAKAGEKGDFVLFGHQMILPSKRTTLAGIFFWWIGTAIGAGGSWLVVRKTSR